MEKKKGEIRNNPGNTGKILFFLSISEVPQISRTFSATHLGGAEIVLFINVDVIMSLILHHFWLKIRAF